MRLYLIRHGQSVWNASQRLQGQADIALSDLGQQQAERVAGRLATSNLTHVYSSDLIRAKHTAQPVANALGLPVVEHAALRERHFGDWQGLEWDNLVAQYPTEWEPVFRGIDGHAPGGESYRDMYTRSERFLKDLADDRTVERVALFTHGGTLRCLIGNLLGMPPERVWRFRSDNCGITVIETYPEGAIMNTHNDLGHLNGLIEPAW